MKIFNTNAAIMSIIAITTDVLVPVTAGVSARKRSKKSRNYDNNRGCPKRVFIKFGEPQQIFASEDPIIGDKMCTFFRFSVKEICTNYVIIDPISPFYLDKDFEEIGGLRAGNRNVIDAKDGELLYDGSGTFSFNDGSEITYDGTFSTKGELFDKGYNLVGGTGRFIGVEGEISFGTPPGEVDIDGGFSVLFTCF